MTFDPLKLIERPKTRAFGGLPSAAPGTVLVVDREGHPLRTLTGPGDRLTAGEVRWGQIRTLYEVDVSDHTLEFQDSFPCRDDIGGFKADVKLSCAVVDPAAVVTRGIHDVARVLFPKMAETLRRACGEYHAEDFQEAETAGLAAIRDLESGPGHDPAFHISHIHLVLALDDAAAIYVRQRKEATRDLARQEDAARLSREKARLEAELAQSSEKYEQDLLGLQRERQRLEAELADQRQELELARTAQKARTEQKSADDLELERLMFERQRQRMVADLEKQKLELELERAEIRDRLAMQELETRLQRDKLEITELTDLLSRGQYAALAMRLAQNPAAIGPVSVYLAEQRAADTNHQIEALEFGCRLHSRWR